MIQPVRPVGWDVSSAPVAVYAVCRRLGLRPTLSQAIWLPWIRLPLALRGYLAATAGILRDREAGALLADPWSRAESWEPWPAHAPFAQETVRWWPSDDWPPASPPVVIEDHLPDAPSEVIDWRACGSLLDFWM